VISAADGGGLAPALAASRARLVLVGALFALAGIAWWSTDKRMRGMDAGPGSGLRTLGWFLGVWIVMMAAMMFPSIAPMVLMYASLDRSRRAWTPLEKEMGRLKKALARLAEEHAA